MTFAHESSCNPPTLVETEAVVTLAIPTRGRPEMLARAVHSALSNAPLGTPILVIDQSPEPSSEMSELESHGLLRYIRDEGRGSSRAHNLALRHAASRYVVFIDDDCELEPATIPSLVEAVAQAQDIGVAYGTVFAYESVASAGFIPTYSPSSPRILRGRMGKLRDGGIGACHIVRRDVALQVGGYDERLGPGGTRFQSCLDGEFTYRVLSHGYAVAHAPAARVLHHGLRPWDEGGRYAFQVYCGIGAAYASYLRRRDPVAVLLLLQQMGFILGDMASELVRVKRPRGFRRLWGLATGIRLGFTMHPLIGKVEEAHLNATLGN